VKAWGYVALVVAVIARFTPTQVGNTPPGDVGQALA